MTDEPFMKITIPKDETLVVFSGSSQSWVGGEPFWTEGRLRRDGRWEHRRHYHGLRRFLPSFWRIKSDPDQ